MVTVGMATAAKLDDSSWAALGRAVRRLEEAWRNGSTVEFDKLLPPLSNPIRERVLIELIKVDQEFRWRRGEQRFLETYLSEWPELGGSDAAGVELIAAECLTRAMVEELPRSEEIQARFPSLWQRIDLGQIQAEAQSDRASSRGGSSKPEVVTSAGAPLGSPASPAAETSKDLQHVTIGSSEPPTPSPLPTGKRFGRYEIRSLVGRGGMGAAYRALDTQLGREIALKVPSFDPKTDPVVLERFLREARAAASIRHPNVCPVHDVGEIDGIYYISMALVEGQSLAGLLNRASTNSIEPPPVASAAKAVEVEGHTAQREKAVTAPNPRESAEIVRKLALALAKIHAAGVIHRDVKPSNVMIDESGEPLLMDFGLARQTQVGTGHEKQLTTTGSLVGTPAYMSPEQVAGEHAAVDARTDIYSLGVLLYQMLTGKLAFEGPLTQVLINIAQSEPPAPRSIRPELDGELDSICMKAMAKRLSDRYQSAAELASALDHYLRRPHPASTPQRVDTSRVQRRWRTSRISAVAAAILLALVPLGYFFGGHVVRIVTNKGTIVIETDGAGIEVIIKDQEGKVLVEGETKREITFAARTVNIEVTVKDSSGEQRFVTDRFTLTRNGKKTVDARWETAAAKPRTESADPDRRAAEWVLSIGGKVTIPVNGMEREIKTTKDLPVDPIQIVKVDLAGNKRLTDAGLENLKGLNNLTSLVLHSTDIGDDGLVHLRDLHSLTSLLLHDTKVSDVGMEHIKGLTNLTWLELPRTEVSDAGLEHLKGLKKLASLGLKGTRVSDAGLEHLKGLTELGALGLSETKVSDAGLEHLKLMSKLTNLGLDHTQVSDAGLMHLKAMTKLRVLFLDGTGVSDAGLDQLKDLTNLSDLRLSSTKVTATGVARLQQARPNCRIAWDSAADPDRRAAEWVLSIGGSIGIKENGRERQTAAFGDLPQGAFELAEVHLNNNPKVSDAGLAHFKDCKNLTLLDLRGSQVSNAGLAHFKDCKKLTFLQVSSSQVSDAGLAHFKDCKNLTLLELSGTQVSDAGLAHLKDCKNLTSLNLGSTQVSDAGLAHFADCRNITQLYLYNTQVSDAGLAHLKDCKNLTMLFLNGTQVSDAGLAHFKDCKNITQLYLHSTQVSDTGLAHFKDCKNLTILFLNETQVSDAGLAHFKKCKNLTSLELRGTRVSDAGLAQFKDCTNLTHLRLDHTKMSDAGLTHFKDCKNLSFLGLEFTRVSDAALADLVSLPRLGGLSLDNTRISLRGHEQLKIAMPKCQIVGWFEPNRSVAESVLALGGIVEIGVPGQPESRPIKLKADLPGDYFQVRRVSIAGVAKPLDKLPELLSLLRFPEFDRLENIDLSGITGLDYGFLVPIHSLRELSLANAGLNDDGLAKLPKLPGLKRLVLDDNGLSDAGIKHLAGLANLESLDLRRTKASPAGIAELQQALPNCKVSWDDPGAPDRPDSSNR